MGLYALAVKAFHREQDASTLTVGYSCVVFAWMAFLAASAGEPLSIPSPCEMQVPVVVSVTALWWPIY